MWARSCPLFPEINSRSLWICPEAAFLRLTTVETSTPAFLNTEQIKKKNEHHYFWESCNFFSVSNDEYTAAHWDEFGILLRQKNATISARETNRTKKPMSTTAQTYWQSSAEIWEGQRNYSQKNEVHKDAISCFSIRKDWRFAVRAKSFALHWRSRGFFRGHVRSCEKGLWSTGTCYPASILKIICTIVVVCSLVGTFVMFYEEETSPCQVEEDD